MIRSSTVTLSFTTVSSAPTLSLDSGKTIGSQEVIAMEVSSNANDNASYQKNIVITKLGSFQSTQGIGMISWNDLDSSSTGNPREFSMLVRYGSTTSLGFRYGGYNRPISTANKTFTTIYVHRI
jgi:hypothetical protein